MSDLCPNATLQKQAAGQVSPNGCSFLISGVVERVYLELDYGSLTLAGYFGERYLIYILCSFFMCKMGTIKPTSQDWDGD